MQMIDEYRLSQYQDLGLLDDKKNIHIKRRITDGRICVEKHISCDMLPVYHILQQIQSPYIPEIYECIQAEEKLILIEEYIEGKTIGQIMQEECMEEKEAVRVIVELCKGLAPLHHAEPSVICRDMKAENIMIDRNGNVKIVDFNIARLFEKEKKHDTVYMGTAGYAAPEQFGFQQTDRRADIYALGVLLNYMLTRQFPVEQIADGKLQPVIQKCIHLDREQRYQNVEELQRELQRIYYNGKRDLYGSGENRNAEKKKYSFIPPGFRKRNPRHILAAVAGYLFIGWFCYTLELEEDNIILIGLQLRAEQTAIFLSQIAFVFIIWNYRGWREKLPFANNSRKVVRILWYAAAECVLIVIAALVCVVIESVFF